MDSEPEINPDDFEYAVEYEGPEGRPLFVSIPWMSMPSGYEGTMNDYLRMVAYVCFGVPEKARGLTFRLIKKPK